MQSARLSSASRLPLKHITLALVIRELIAPWTGHPYDFEIWTRLGFYMQNLSNPYTTLPYVSGLSFAPSPTTGSISYPPFSAFIFALTYRLYLLLGAPSRFVYYFLLKQPMIFADIGIALAIGKIILLSGQTRSARLATLIWLYFPLGLIISSVWGQLDPLSLFLSLLAAYYFLTSKTALSAVMLGLSIYLKTLPVVFLPIFLLQHQLSAARKLLYSGISLAIPCIGTLAPSLLLSWGLRGMYNNFAFQVSIPSTGAMSVLGQVSVILSVQGAIRSFIGLIWIPAIIVSYIYVWKRHTPIFQGLLFVILAFSISRPFLPEQWSLYPLAFLLLTNAQKSLEHFLGLSVAATGFLVTNNTLMVRFFSPITVAAFNWDIAVNTQSPLPVMRTIAALFLSLLFFLESVQVLMNKESIVYRVLVLGSPLNRLLHARVSPLEVAVS